MLRYQKVFEDEDSVTYQYFPEDEELFGTVVFDKKKNAVISKEVSSNDSRGSYWGHMTSRLREFNKMSNFRENGIVAWY